MSEKIRREFWGWDRPVLEQAVEWLAADWDGAAALDLSATLILVPTAEAGRRLREGLARHVESQGGGVMAPWVWHPEQALLPEDERRDVGNAQECQMAWMRVLHNVKTEDFPALFPVPPTAAGWAWHAETARMLLDLQSQLGVAGHDFQSVATDDAAKPDAGRWRELALLEERFKMVLKESGLRHGQLAKRELASAPTLPEEVKRVVVLPAPDLPPLLKAWLGACAEQGREVVVAIHAPTAMAPAFDGIGRPQTSYWGEATTEVVPLDSASIKLAENPTRQAAWVLSELKRSVQSGRVAVGLCDPELGAVLREKLTLEGVRVLEPGGAAATSEGLWHVLTTLSEMVGSGSWRALGVLLRNPDVARMLAGPGASQTGLLMAADELSSKRVPVTLAHAAELMGEMEAEDDESKSIVFARNALRRVIESARQWVTTFEKQSLPKAARAWLLALYGERIFVPDSPGDRERTELAAEWLRLAETLEKSAHRFGLKPKSEEALAMSLQWLSRTSLPEPRGEVDLVLQGWLELLWEGAPNLVICGLNEEHVPGILTGHPFLPDRLRDELGLPCQATRFARDHYLLRAMAEQRAESGALTVCCGQWSERGDAMRPSRLLMLCPDDVLPARVAHLFPSGEDAVSDPVPVRTLAWQLRPQAESRPLEKISSTRLSSYLRCPYRYFLQNVLQMSAVDPSSRELGANVFGQLIHSSLQRMASDQRVAVSEDAEEIATFLEEQLRALARGQFGVRPAPLVSLQIDSACQRLRHAAEQEALLRAEGWQIVEAEFALKELKKPLMIDGAQLTGTVDRIERHADGRVRIVDFKTSDKAKKPQEAHVQSLKRRKLALEDEWKTLEIGGEPFLWSDLQLPLYAAALNQSGWRVDEVAYFSLPKNVQGTVLQIWDGFGDEWIDAAVGCAGEVVKRIRDGVFWPPAKVTYDDFEEILLGDAEAASVAPLIR